MKAQRLLIVLAVFNLALLVFLLAQTRVHIGSRGVRVWTSIDGSVALFRLIDQDGRPSVKLGVSERGGGLMLGTNSQGNYVQLSGQGLKVTKDGQPQMTP